MRSTHRGLVIKEAVFGEGSKMLTLLVPALGKIQVAARGARSYKSKYRAACQLFCYSEFVLVQRGGRYSVSEAEPIHAFYPLRERLEALGLAAYFCDLLSEVASDQSDAPAVLRLALNTLYILCGQDGYGKIKAAFELRLMCEAGFSPSLDACCVCGAAAPDGRPGFSVSGGGVLCNRCGGERAVLPATLLAMRHICECDMKKLFAFQVSPQVLDELSSLCENYTLAQLGRTFSSLKYYLTIITNMV